MSLKWKQKAGIARKMKLVFHVVSVLMLKTLTCCFSECFVFQSHHMILSILLGTGIKCWVCRSLEDPKCADPFDNTSTPFFDCATFPQVAHLPGVKATMCRKIRQKVNGEWRYIRSCARLGEPGIGGDERYCLQRSGTFNIHIESCTCNSKDGCNHASSLMPFNLMYVAAVPSVLGILNYLRF